LQAGTLGGKFTTIEGLLQNIFDELYGKLPFIQGDSKPEVKKRKFDNFLSNLKKV
jgi:zinc finger protein